MGATIDLKETKYESTVEKLDAKIKNAQDRLTNIRAGAKNAEESIQTAKARMKEIKFELFINQRMRELEVVMKRLIQEFREKKVE